MAMRIVYRAQFPNAEFLAFKNWAQGNNIVYFSYDNIC